MDSRAERSKLEEYYRQTDKASHLFVLDKTNSDKDKDGVVPAQGFKEIGMVMSPFIMNDSLTDDLDTCTVTTTCLDSIYNVHCYDDRKNYSTMAPDNMTSLTIQAERWMLNIGAEYLDCNVFAMLTVGKRKANCTCSINKQDDKDMLTISWEGDEEAQFYKINITGNDGSEGMVRECKKPLPERCKIYAESPAEVAGSIMRLQLYGDVGDFKTEDYTFRRKDDEGNIEETEVALPLNYRNYMVSYSTSKHKCYEYSYYDLERNKLTTHNYTLVELMAYLQSFPVRSTKTFAEGKYTWRRILEICFELFFKPRNSGSFVILGDETLDQLNTRKAYTNATVYDVVRDIAQQLDRVPKLEYAVSENGRDITYQLMLFPKTGAGFSTTDINYFDWAEAKVDISALNQSAGNVLSNVRSLVPDGGAYTYPNSGAIQPNNTNMENSWRVFKTPTPIKRIKEIRIYTEKKFTSGKSTWFVLHVDPDGKRLLNQFAQYNNCDITDDVDYNYFYKLTEGDFIELNASDEEVKPINIYFYEQEDYKYLPQNTGDSDSGRKQPSKDKSIWYSKGSDEIHVDCLFDKKLTEGVKNIAGGSTFFYKWRDGFAMVGSSYVTYKFEFNESKANSGDKFSIFQMSVTYEPIIEDAALKAGNILNEDITVLYNQLGEQVSVTGFLDNLNSYANDMEERSVQRGKVIAMENYKNPYAFAQMWQGVPRVGANVYDAATNKHYVITALTYNVKNVKAEIIATLDEKSAGVAKTIKPNSGIELGVLSNEDTVKSNTNIEFRIRLGLTPQKGGRAIFTPFKSDAFLGITGAAGSLYHKPKYLAVLKSATRLTDNDTEGYLLPLMSGVYNGGLYFIANFKHNKVAGIKNGEGIFYTDLDGQLDKAAFYYLHNLKATVLGADLAQDSIKFTNEDVQKLIANPSVYSSFFAVRTSNLLLPLYKDGHEISGFTTQITYNGADGLMISPLVPKRAKFWEPKESELQIVLLNNEINISNSKWKDFEVCRFNISSVSQSEAGLNYNFKYNIRNLPDVLPQHKAWALIDEDNELRLANNSKLVLDSDGKLVIYYGVKRNIL